MTGDPACLRANSENILCQGDILYTCVWGIRYKSILLRSIVLGDMMMSVVNDMSVCKRKEGYRKEIG